MIHLLEKNIIKLKNRLTDEMEQKTTKNTHRHGINR